MWSKKGTPVLMSVAPVPSRLMSTRMLVSLVKRSICAVRLKRGPFLLNGVGAIIPRSITLKRPYQVNGALIVTLPCGAAGTQPAAPLWCGYMLRMWAELRSRRSMASRMAAPSSSPFLGFFARAFCRLARSAWTSWRSVFSTSRLCAS